MVSEMSGVPKSGPTRRRRGPPRRRSCRARPARASNTTGSEEGTVATTRIEISDTGDDAGQSLEQLAEEAKRAGMAFAQARQEFLAVAPQGPLEKAAEAKLGQSPQALAYRQSLAAMQAAERGLQFAR